MNILLQVQDIIPASEVLKITPWTAGGYGLALLVLCFTTYSFYKLYQESKTNERATLIEITKFMPVMLDRLDINEATKEKLAIIMNEIPTVKQNVSHLPGIKEKLEEIKRLIEDTNKNLQK